MTQIFLRNQNRTIFKETGVLNSKISTEVHVLTFASHNKFAMTNMHQTVFTPMGKQGPDPQIVIVSRGVKAIYNLPTVGVNAIRAATWQNSLSLGDFLTCFWQFLLRKCVDRGE